jgi:hypothetical protein
MVLVLEVQPKLRSLCRARLLPRKEIPDSRAEAVELPGGKRHNAREAPWRDRTCLMASRSIYSPSGVSRDPSDTVRRSSAVHPLAGG